MKKFSFNLRALLELREWEEQLARQSFSHAVHEVSNLEDKTRRVEEEKESICRDWDKSHTRSFSRNERLALNAAIADAGQASKEARNALVKAEQRRDEALSKMKLAVRKKKVVANLKQRRLEEYQAEALRQETIEIEDIYNARSIERTGI
jgi:flagellar FliJ protein